MDYGIQKPNELELSYINKIYNPLVGEYLLKLIIILMDVGLYKFYKDKTWKATRIQSYDTKKFWKYIDWYASGYSKDTFINYRYEFNSISK